MGRSGGGGTIRWCCCCRPKKRRDIPSCPSSLSQHIQAPNTDIFYHSPGRCGCCLKLTHLNFPPMPFTVSRITRITTKLFSLCSSISPCKIIINMGFNPYVNIMIIIMGFNPYVNIIKSCGWTLWRPVTIKNL